MVTIKDIAKAAGVAQGTVSNVLNSRGNVSSEKIRHVLEVSQALGYVPNERAKLLRKGHANLLAVLLPDLHSKQYIDFYISFKAYAETHGYMVCQYMAGQDTPNAEENIIKNASSDMVMGMAVFSGCLHLNDPAPYQESRGARPMSLLFVERKPSFKANYIGFDYEKAGRAMAGKALERHYVSVTLLTGSLRHSNEADFYHGFMQTMEGSNCTVNFVETDDERKHQNILQAFNTGICQALFVSNSDFAETARDILTAFYDEKLPAIYTVSSMHTMPETDFEKYELNYRLLGNAAAKQLIAEIKEPSKLETIQLENAGFRDWFPHTPALRTGSSPLNVLTLDSPTAYTMRHLSRIYTKHTGIPVNITIYSYDEIYEAFNNLREDAIFDVLRLDVTWLSWFAEKVLQPLEQIDPSVAEVLPTFLKGTPEQYSYVNGVLYALPSTPSTQVLFYRKDLFESAIYRRTFQEQYKAELAPPTTFEAFNRVASYFTKAVNPDSPVDYGATLTLGSTGVSGSEFLARLFSVQEHLYDQQGRVRLNSPQGVHALEQLIEVKRYSDPQYCTWWTGTATAFAKGNVAMSILYNNFASAMLSHASKVVDNIGYALMPGGRPIIGGGALGVSRYSRQPENALHFIRWMCSEPVASANTLLGGVSPCLQSYNNYEIINNFPWLKLVKSCFSLAKGRRTPPDSAHPFDERRFMSIIGMAVKNAYSDAMSPQNALDYAQKLFDEQFMNP